MYPAASCSKGGDACAAGGPQEGLTGDLEGAGAAGLRGEGNMGQGSASEGGMSTSCSGSTGIGIMGGKEGIGGTTGISECRKGASTMLQMRGVD